MPKTVDSKVVPLKPEPDPLLPLTPSERIGLKLDARAKPIGCLENVVTVLRTHPAWREALAFNDLTQGIEKQTALPFPCCSQGSEWTDTDDDQLDLWLSQNFELRAGKLDCGRAVGIVARDKTIHPIRAYLDALNWNGNPRIDTWLVDKLGAQVPTDDGDIRTADYYRKAGRWWLISAVARIYRPGCQADHVLLLEGAQGIGKSTALRILFGDWFSDTPLNIGNKDSFLALNGVWGVELAELDSLNRAESSAAKAFFTSMRDKYRPPYGRRDVIVPRQVVFAGTVNHDQYLRDSTGNRRYWPVRCGKLRLRGEHSLEADRDQLFAEAVAAFRAGEAWYPTTDEECMLFTQQQSEREHGDVYEALIRNGALGRVEITMAEIFKEILDIEPAKMTRAEQIRVGEAMHALGWRKKRQRKPGGREYVYLRPEQSNPSDTASDDIPF